MNKLLRHLKPLGAWASAVLTGLAVLAVTPGPAAAQGQSSAPSSDLAHVDAGHTRATLIPEAAAAAPGQPFWALVRLSPDEGWHTYWRNPGDSGVPTRIEWDLPEGFEAGAIQWPVPERIPYGPLTNYGYEGPVALPVQITPPGDLPPGETVEISAKSEWLVCEEICIPESADLTATIETAAVPRADSNAAETVTAALAHLPQEGPDGAFETAENKIRIQVPLSEKRRGGAPERIEFFPHDQGYMDNAAGARWQAGEDGIGLVLTRGVGDVPETLVGLVKVVDSSGDAAGYTVTLEDGTVPAAAVASAGGAAVGGAAGEGGSAAGKAAGIGFPQALLFAFVGGLILNLMPCVFPVLSIKAMTLAGSAHSAPHDRRMEGLAYTAGILVCFGIIGALLLALRAGGAAIGWGFQLQSPLFVAAMAFVLFTLGLSFSGFFAIGGGFAGIGQSLTEKPGHRGAFFTGALATLVATPCTAPFMAAALGYALVLPAYMALPLFLTLGLGLAAPILVLSASPALAKFLPKPGPWMETFRQFLAFLLYATVVWLLWVLGRQVGVDGLALALGGLVLIGFIVWALRAMPARPVAARWARGVAAALAVLFLISTVYAIGTQPLASADNTANTAAETGLTAESYSEARLNQYLAEGEPVFVNFTADWCITCKANEQVALSTDRVKTAFEANNVRYLKGDWTNRDPEITAVLERFGRSGVPLYLYYSGRNDGEDPRVLPQILTPGMLVAAVEED